MPSTAKESNNLNVLRASAVLMVFFDHALNLPRLGDAGVLFFFVHTSNVLMQSLQRSGDSWKQFVTRRVFRIYPLSILAVILYAVLCIPGTTLNGGTPKDTGFNILSDVALIQNITGAQSIPIVLWSLPFEIQMYLVLPFCFWWVGRMRKVFLVQNWVLVAGTTAVLMGWFPATGLVIRFVPSFFAGIISFFLPQDKRLPSAAWAAAIIMITLAFLALPILATGWVVCLILGYAIPKFREMPDTIITKGAAFIAKYSFGIYLFHLLFLVLFSPMKFEGVALALCAAIVSSWAMFRLVEDPMIRLGKKIAQSMRDVKLQRPASGEAIAFEKP
ncbi:MAG: acyltransferase family protein [Acidobacteriaceae bacterium]